MVWVGQLCMMCSGILITVTIAGPNAEVNTVLFALLMWLFSGLSPPAAEFENTAFGAAGLFISFARWMYGSELTSFAITGSECQATTLGYTMQELGLIKNGMSTRPLTLTLTNTTTTTVEIPYYADGQNDYDKSIEHQMVLGADLKPMVSLAAHHWPLRSPITRSLC